MNVPSSRRISFSFFIKKTESCRKVERAYSSRSMQTRFNEGIKTTRTQET